MTQDFYAHTLPDAPPSAWQPLEEHLEAVAELAASFASAFGAADWGRLTGLWHDVGKYSTAFQEFLAEAGSNGDKDRRRRGRDHATAGAQHAASEIPVLGYLIAYIIAGHHTGLPDGRSDKSSSLEARLRKTIDPWRHGLQHLGRTSTVGPPPMLLRALKERDGFSAAFFTRMVFSCLVDADFLDTEKFMDPKRAASRPEWPSDILERMESCLSAYVTTLGGGSGSAVGGARTGVRTECLDAADLEPGLFSLTVPTGGGKTLSSLAFALRHAQQHGLKRVVYVIPFTSIIEQNAREFRLAMAQLSANGGPDVVLEHHSDLDVKEETNASRLATENWEAPIVVTTAVQFYESLFARKTSRCRKLHNLAEAVIILDEVQTLPVDLLASCLRAINELAQHYGSTVVLCTATQPAIQLRDDFAIGLQGVREIVTEPKRLYESLQRVTVADIGPCADQDLSARLLTEQRVLCVVNTRSHAARLYDSLGEGESHFHLSARMCPAHRTEVFKTIRGRLDDGMDCRVVTTQLIEAGVNIDFPAVYRSLAGLDSIAQAAGRCNRNGNLGERAGRVYVFHSEHVRSERFFSETANCGRQVLDLYRDDPLRL